MNERVKELRKVLNLTMEKFGDRLGVKKNSISQIESGNRSLTDQMFLAICREFSVNEDWLRTGSGEMFIVTRSDYIEKVSRSYNLDKLDEVIINTYILLEPEKRKIIKEYILAVAENYKEDEDAKIKAKIDEEVEAYRRELELEAKGWQDYKFQTGKKNNKSYLSL